MDADRFDKLTRTLFATGSRRQALAAALAAAGVRFSVAGVNAVTCDPELEITCGQNCCNSLTHFCCSGRCCPQGGICCNNKKCCRPGWSCGISTAGPYCCAP